jgi:hypothetical protein
MIWSVFCFTVTTLMCGLSDSLEALVIVAHPAGRARAPR